MGIVIDVHYLLSFFRNQRKATMTLSHIYEQLAKARGDLDEIAKRLGDTKAALRDVGIKIGKSAPDSDWSSALRGLSCGEMIAWNGHKIIRSRGAGSFGQSWETYMIQDPEGTNSGHFNGIQSAIDYQDQEKRGCEQREQS